MRREAGIGLLVCLALLFERIPWQGPGAARRTATTIGAAFTSSTSKKRKEFEDILRPRAFKPWKYGLEALCKYKGAPPPVISKRGGKFTSGFLYLKPSKTGSSTASGINLRIARNVARRLHKNFTYCPATYRHHDAHDKFRGRNIHHSFLWTILRDPTSRAQSSFFHFKVAREHVRPSDKNYVRYLQDPKISQHYRRKVALTSPPSTKNVTNQGESPQQTQQAMQDILDQYNFVGITERFDESLVVLQMLLDLPVDDILYLNAKTSGGYDDGVFRNTCTYIVPKFTSPGMQIYFDSSAWKNVTYFEQALYVAANRSLDLTIDAVLGRERFAQHLQHFRHVQTMALEMCQADAVFPCLASGVKSPARERDCLFSDSGCGDACLTRAAAAATDGSEIMEPPGLNDIP